MTSDHLAALRRQSQAAVDAAKARFNRWHTKHVPRLAGMHSDVAAEVRSLAADRFHAGQEAAISDKDLRECLMRVASRVRLKRWGPCSPEEAGDQLRAIVGELEQRREAEG